MLKSYRRACGLFRTARFNFSIENETSSLMAQFEEKLAEGDSEGKLEPYVLKKKDSVVYIKNLQEKASFMSLLRINTSAALCIGIEKSMVTALVLNNIINVDNNSSVEMHPMDDIKIPLKNLGNVIDFSGQHIFDFPTHSSNSPENGWQEETVDMVKGLEKAPYRRKLISSQMYTGHMRIDLNQPMAENNFIVLKGPSNSGKNLVIKDMIKYFLKNDKEGNHRVVYVTPYIKDAKNVHQNVLSEEEREKCTILTPSKMSQNSAEIYLMPRSALVIAQKLRKAKCNVLFVFDKVIEYDINQKTIFDNAKQPFSPTNIYNEIMENTGDFGPDDGKMTSVIALDTDTVNFNYEKYMTGLLNHLESISDQIVDFEPTLKAMKSSLPKLDLSSFTGLNPDYWQKPLVAYIRKELENFTGLLKNSFQQKNARQELGFHEDPWDNYLYYDSKFIVPLLNHREPLDIVEQILVFKFIQQSIGEDSEVSIQLLLESKILYLFL